jgi:hypothetical protein
MNAASPAPAPDLFTSARPSPQARPRSLATSLLHNK